MGGGNLAHQSKKKGFTLIELLAVIVVLAVIALIATPIIMNVISDAKKGAFKDSLYSLIKAVENYQMKLVDGSDSSFVIDLPSDILNIKNGDFTEGYIGVSKAGKVSFLAGNGSYCATKGFDEEEIKVMDGNCDSQTPKKCFATTNNGKNISEYLCDGTHDGYEKIVDVIIPRQIVDGVDVTASNNGDNKGIFYNKKINSLFLPNTIKVLGDSTVRNNNLKGIIIPNSVTTIYDDCFANNQLTNVVIPKTVTHIGAMTFSDNKLPENQAYIYGRDASGNPTTRLVSYGGYAKEVYIPEGTETISGYAFVNSNYDKLVLPATLQKITNYNFLNGAASEIIIGENVSLIESASINNGNGKLKKIIFYGKIPPIVATSAFGLANTGLQEIYVPKGMKQVYYNALKDVQIDSSRKITEAMIIEQ